MAANMDNIFIPEKEEKHDKQTDSSVSYRIF
jgi:hypothetical protein